VGAPGRRPPTRLRGLPLGLPRRSHRRSPLLSRHQLESGPPSLVGASCGLGRRARDLGWDRLRNTRRPVGATSPRCRHPAVSRRRRARAPRRSVDRPPRQLLQPRALRRTDLAAVGACDRPGSSPTGVRGLHDLPADLPLRNRLEPGARRISRLAGEAWQGAPARAICALRRRILRLSDLRGAPARRSRPAPVRAAPELLRRHRSLPHRPGVVCSDATHPGPPIVAMARNHAGGRRDGGPHLWLRPIGSFRRCGRSTRSCVTGAQHRPGGCPTAASPQIRCNRRCSFLIMGWRKWSAASSVANDDYA
jgi:hypothetical protein